MSIEEYTNTTVNLELHNSHQNSQYVFMPGQTISGRVNVFCPSAITIRGIIVRISGQVKCQFVEVSGERFITHVGEETYIQEDIYVLGNDSGSQRLEPGSSFYSFEYKLPDALPVSLKSKFGHIRYWISVILNRPMRFDTKIDVNFTIKTDLNLNDYPALKSPVEDDWTNHYYMLGCCLCLKTGKFAMLVKIPVGGYVAGNKISIKLSIDNKSNHPMESFTIQLIELVTCHPYPVKAAAYVSEEKTIVEKVIEGCSGTATDERRITLNIPVGVDFRPSNDLSNVLKLRHALKVTGNAGRCHMDPIVYIPIKLGTINWERKPSIVPSEAGPEIDTMIASLGDNLYQAEYLNWNAQK